MSSRTDVADLGAEVVADGQVIELQSVAIAGVIELGAVARVVARHPPV
jgi:hypothetical protein